MLDLNQLINEFSPSVEDIVCNHWNPKRMTLTDRPNEYKLLVTTVVWLAIEKTKQPELENALLDLEKEIPGTTPDPERCRKIAKLLKNALDHLHQKAFYKDRRERKEKMEKALKEITIPFLRKQGFKGSFPNFKLKNENQEITLQFQFSQFGSQFVIELKSAAKEPLRLGSILHKRDYWYDFEKDTSPDIFKTRAYEIIENWSEAENWMINK